MLQRYGPAEPQQPSLRQLAQVALASGLPFVGFGFVDNAIMITAGEQIDHLFGVRFGITAMASAALGNVCADVVGVSVTQQIKQHSRNARWAQPPRLSSLQQGMRNVRGKRGWGGQVGAVGHKDSCHTCLCCRGEDSWCHPRCYDRLPGGHVAASIHHPGLLRGTAAGPRGGSSKWDCAPAARAAGDVAPCHMELQETATPL
jgi:hypothetical protein